jgi:hypothetical protein
MNIDIKRNEFENHIDYIIQKDGEYVGIAKISFLEIGKGTGTLVDGILNEKCHVTGELIASISEFYPHGWRADNYNGLEDQMGQGLGTQILENMLKSCNERKISVLYTSTKSDSMKNFCKKYDFEDTGVSRLDPEDVYLVKEL